MKCPFCGKEMEDFPSMECSNAIGGKYVCYKKICKNIKEHYGNGKIVIPYKPKEK